MTKTFKHIIIRTENKTYSFPNCTLAHAMGMLHRASLSDKDILKIICK